VLVATLAAGAHHHAIAPKEYTEYYLPCSAQQILYPLQKPSSRQRQHQPTLHYLRHSPESSPEIRPNGDILSHRPTPHSADAEPTHRLVTLRGHEASSPSRQCTQPFLLPHRNYQRAVREISSMQITLDRNPRESVFHLLRPCRCLGGGTRKPQLG